MGKTCSPTTRICAMCMHWNGYAGGQYVKPKTGMRTFFVYDPEEVKTCYKNHFEKKAWHSCNEWQKKY